MYKISEIYYSDTTLLLPIFMGLMNTGNNRTFYNKKKVTDQQKEK
jgi:hypothetical protein